MHRRTRRPSAAPTSHWGVPWWLVVDVVIAVALLSYRSIEVPMIARGTQNRSSPRRRIGFARVTSRSGDESGPLAAHGCPDSSHLRGDPLGIGYAAEKRVCRRSEAL